MAQSADEMIASLGSLVAAGGNAPNEEALDIAIEGFESLPDRGRVVPTLFAVMERWPEDYMGSPGPLVHSIETIPVSEFAPELVSSVHRQPGVLNVWMVNRILNSAIPTPQRTELLKLLNSIKSHPRAPSAAKQSAVRYLLFQAKREEK
jgi:hypothetical protein